MNTLLIRLLTLKSVCWQVKISTIDNSQAWIKALAFSKIGNHIYDRSAEFPGVSFNVKHLEKMSSDELESNGRMLISITDGEPNTKDTLTNNSVVYHHNCTPKYEELEIDSLRRKVQNSEDGPLTRKRKDILRSPSRRK